MSSGRRAPADPYVPGHGDESYGVDRYDISLTYRPSSNRLDAEATIDVTLRTPCRELGFDLAGLTVRKVRIEGRRSAKYTQHRAGQKVVVGLPETGRAGDCVRVVIAYSGSPAPIRSTWGDVGWEELHAGALVAGQPNGAPSWFPCNDRPSDKATYRIAVTTDTPFTALANGVLVERRTAASTTTWVYEQDEPMATYLATVQIGQYEIRELRGSAVRQRVARSPRVADAVAGDLARQDEMMACFTGLFGQYPFRCYTVVVTDDPLEIPLEAQAMSIFGSNHLAGRGDHERLVAHELAHQWFGNSLTVARWSDIWLNEGFACYAEWLWSEASGEADAQTHADREWTRLHRRPKDLLLADPGPADMFDDRVYKRGALTLHALRTLLGDDAFFAMLQTWVADHRHGSVATADFVDLATATAGEPARDLLTAWLFDRSLPARPGARPRRRS